MTTEERISHLEGASGQWATKADVAELKAELKGDIGDLKGEIGALRAELKGDIGALRAELKGDISSVIKWMAMLQLAGLAAIAAIMGFLA